MRSRNTSRPDPRTTTAVAALCLLAACAPREAVVERQIIAFSTVVNVRILGTHAADADAAIADLERLYAARDRDWYAWGAGQLGEVNRTLRTGTQAWVDPELAELLRRALALRKLSGGRFDPAAGALTELWHFRDFADGEPGATAPPDDVAIRAVRLLSADGYAIRRDGGRWRVSTARPGVQIDPGGIAKGALLRDGAELLARHGVRAAVLDIGGDLYALGDPGREPYRIGIRGPDARTAGRWLALRPGEAVATSGDYERYWQFGGRRYGHIIDPRTGHPANTASMATVIAEDPLLADAAATALIVGGPAEFFEVCDTMGIERALLVDNGGAILTTPAMQARLRGPGAEQ